MTQQQQPTSRLNIQIIAGSLLAGIAFAFLFLFDFDKLAAPQPANQQEEGVIFGVILAVICFGLSMVLPLLINRVFREQNKQLQEPADEQFFLRWYQTRMILRLTPLEAAAFANIFLANGTTSLLIVGWMVLMMVAFFPVSSRIDHWIRTQRELLEFEQNK